MSTDCRITQLFRAFRNNVFYREFARRTLSASLDRYAKINPGDTRVHTAMEALFYAYEHKGEPPPARVDDYVEAINAAAPPGSPDAEKIRCLQTAAARFAALPSPREDSNATTPYIRARRLLNRVKHGKRSVFLRLKRSLLELEPHTPECYDLAARLLFVLNLITHQRVVRASADDVIDSFNFLVHRKFRTDAPEVYQLASLKILSGLIEDEFPGFYHIVNNDDGAPDALIDPSEIRDARHQARAYITLSSRFRDDSHALYKEAAWLNEITVCSFGDDTRYYFIRHSAMDAFMALTPRLNESVTGRGLLHNATRKLAAFVSQHKRPPDAYHQPDMERAEKELAVLLALDLESRQVSDDTVRV